MPLSYAATNYMIAVNPMTRLTTSNDLCYAQCKIDIEATVFRSINLVHVHIDGSVTDCGLAVEGVIFSVYTENAVVIFSQLSCTFTVIVFPIVSLAVALTTKQHIPNVPNNSHLRLWRGRYNNYDYVVLLVTAYFYMCYSPAVRMCANVIDTITSLVAAMLR